MMIIVGSSLAVPILNEILNIILKKIVQIKRPTTITNNYVNIIKVVF